MIYLLDTLIYFLAWAFQGFTGFGAGIFIVGVLSLFHDPREVVVSSALVNLVGVFSLIFVGLRRAKPDFRVLLPLIGGSVPGIIAGTKILFAVEKETLRLLIGVFILLLGVYDLGVQRGVLSKIALRRSLHTGLFFGFVGGFFAGLVGIGGPPPVVYLNQVVKNVEVFKLTLNFFFASNIIVRTLSYLLEGGIGSFDPLLIIPAPLSVPAGVFAGMFLFRSIEEGSFKTIVSLSVFVIGVFLVLREIVW